MSRTTVGPYAHPWQNVTSEALRVRFPDLHCRTYCTFGEVNDGRERNRTRAAPWGEAGANEAQAGA
jgi:hypothetical protein